MLEAGRQILEAQAFSTLLGTELVRFEEGFAELQLAITDRLKQQNGFVHGGVLAYLADNALTYAGSTRLPGPPITVEIKVNYIRPAIGERLIARGYALSGGRTQSVARCEIFVVVDGAEKLCAAAQGTIAVLSK